MPQKLNHHHHAIVNWLVAHPTRSLGDCARAFGYTQSYLSILVNSSLFQEAYRRRCDELGAAVVHTMKDKITAIGTLALDRVIERLESGLASERLIGEASRMALQSLGFLNGKGSEAQVVHHNSNHVHFHHVSPQELESARQRASQAALGTAPQKVLDIAPVEVELNGNSR